MAKSFLLAAVAALGLGGCGAVYPQLETPLKQPPPHAVLAPPPPEDLLFLKFAGATIPRRTRDGRNWDDVGGSLPDAFAKLIVSGKVILETPVQGNTLTPTWPDQAKANYHVPSGAAAKVELWDSNPINNHPICVSELPELGSNVSLEAPLQINCNSGAELRLVIQPAHGKMGLGLAYELRQEEIFVTKVLRESPAARAGLVRGDMVLKIQGKLVKSMADGEAQSLINANAQSGVTLLIRKLDRSENEVNLKDGPVYPAVDEGVPIDG